MMNSLIFLVAVGSLQGVGLPSSNVVKVGAVDQQSIGKSDNCTAL